LQASPLSFGYGNGNIYPYGGKAGTKNRGDKYFWTIEREKCILEEEREDGKTKDGSHGDLYCLCGLRKIASKRQIEEVSILVN